MFDSVPPHTCATNSCRCSQHLRELNQWINYYSILGTWEMSRSQQSQLALNHWMYCSAEYWQWDLSRVQSLREVGQLKPNALLRTKVTSLDVWRGSRLLVGESVGQERVKEIELQWNYAPKKCGFPVLSEFSNVDLEDWERILHGGWTGVVEGEAIKGCLLLKQQQRHGIGHRPCTRV